MEIGGSGSASPSTSAYVFTMAAQHQHYVPQLLLRGFLSREPERAAREQVHVFDLETGETFTPSITNIMGERRYNDFWLDEETLATVEPAAGRIESHVAPTVERIRTEKRLERSPEEFGSLARSRARVQTSPSLNPPNFTLGES